MERDRCDARLLHEPVGDLDAALIARPQAGAQLDGHRHPWARALDGGPGDPDREAGVGEQRRPRSGAPDLRHRAAHVDVDGVGPDRRHVRGGAAHDVRVLPEQLYRDRAARMLAGVDPQQLSQVRALPWWIAWEETISETAMPAP